MWCVECGVFVVVHVSGMCVGGVGGVVRVEVLTGVHQSQSLAGATG